LQAPSDADGQICIGELIESNQRWYVDGFEPPRPEEPIEEDEVPAAPELSLEPDPRTSTTPKSKNGGSMFEKTAGALSLAIFWKNRASSRNAPSEVVAPPLNESSKSDDPEQRVEAKEIISSGTAVESGRRSLKKRLTDLRPW